MGVVMTNDQTQQNKTMATNIQTNQTTTEEKARNKAEQLLIKHNDALQAIADFYKKPFDTMAYPPFKIVSPFKHIYQDNNIDVHNPFAYTATAHNKTWARLRTKGVAAIAQNIPDSAHNSQINNVLETMLTSPNEELVYKDLAIGQEMGMMVSRLFEEIARHQKNTRLARDINDKFTYYMYNNGSTESLIAFNNNELLSELTKLTTHAENYPEHKVVWLGTSDAVNAMDERNGPSEIYLNADNDHYTWQLNRAYLQAAVDLGYEFRLVEQHYPEVENALIAGDPSRFIAELAKEIRPSSEHYKPTNQYHGGEEPSATCQEILLLLDMGLVGRKDEDGSIVLKRPQKSYEADAKSPVVHIKKDENTNRQNGNEQSQYSWHYEDKQYSIKHSYDFNASPRPNRRHSIHKPESQPTNKLPKLSRHFFFLDDKTNEFLKNNIQQKESDQLGPVSSSPGQG